MLDPALSYLPPADGETLLVMTDLVTVKVRSDNPHGAFVLTEVTSPSQGGPPFLHRHPDQETFYVIEGVFRFDTAQGDELSSVEAAPGAVVHIPGMVWHNYKNVGTIPGKLLAVLQPGDMLEFFRELGVPVTDPTNLPRPSGPLDMQRVMGIMQKHHVQVLRLPVTA